MINELVQKCHKNSKEKGFWDELKAIEPLQKENQQVYKMLVANILSSKICLIHSELSEALEAIRKDNKENLAEELADVCIRLFDFAGQICIDLEKEIELKMEINFKRSYRHGKII